MRIEYGIQSNCSESVFRFYTLDPKQIQTILQAIADEISAETGFEPHENQKVTLFKTAEEYDTGYVKTTDKQYDEHCKKLDTINNNFHKKMITEEKRDDLMNAEYDKFQKISYPKGSVLKACAGLGDNEAIITIEKGKKAFRLNIGNNDISDNKTGWIDKIKALGIKVEEAEYSEDLSKTARDCTCGITYFDDYENLIKDKK